MDNPLSHAPDGLLLIDKPSGMTSHDVVAKVRRGFNLKKVGHGGTLDPAATGLLILLIGKGTKLSDRVMNGDKGYEGIIHLGVATSSHDGEGEVLREADASAVTRDQLEAAFAQWVGEVDQIPPMVSAIKKGGVPLYKMARKGQTIERDPRRITIHAIELLDFNPPQARFRMACTKGTYVRTLCHDVGEALGCGAHLAGLIRTRSGPFRLEQTMGLDALLKGGGPALLQHLIPLAEANKWLSDKAA